MKFKEEVLEKVKNLPHLPGVYIMRDARGKIIYIGKAKSLKNRVSSYFKALSDQRVKVEKMVEKIDDFSVIITDTEFEALVLECNLIKTHKPKYNILLKDDKAYPFMKITINEQYPRIMIARKKGPDNAKYYGPYKSTKVIRDTISLLQKLFLIPTCNKVFPRDIGKGKVCLNYHIKRCSGICQNHKSKEEYAETFKEVIAFVEGKREEILKDLRIKMEAYAQDLEFEKAGVIRDRIQSIEKLGDSQKVYSQRETDMDIISYFFMGGKVCITILFIRFGKLLDKDFFIYNEEEFLESDGGLSQFVGQYYREDSYIPRELLINAQEGEDLDALEEFMRTLRGGAVTIKNPKRGERLSMLEMATMNAKEELERVITKEQKERKLLVELQKHLSLKNLPRRIESYDISNMGDTNMVGGMVVFKDCQPYKKDYRRFKIEHQGQDDYTAMKEVIYRRFERYMAGDEKFSEMPDLILLDGGKGHLSAISEMLTQLNIDVEVFGMVKDNSHKTKELIGKNGVVTISKTPHIFAFIGTVQEEVHRFSIDYHKKLREKTTFNSQLADIPLVGKQRQKALLTHFKGVAGIKKASIEELMAVEGVSKKIATAIKSHFSGEKDDDGGVKE